MRERVLSRTCNGRARTGKGSRPHSTRMRASSFNQLVEVEKDACPMLDDERQAVDRNLTRVRCSVFHPGANEQRQFIRGGLLDEAGEEIRVVGRQEILVVAIRGNEVAERLGVRRKRIDVRFVEYEGCVLRGAQDRHVEEKAFQAVGQQIKIVVEDLVLSHFRQAERLRLLIESQFPAQTSYEVPQVVICLLIVTGDVKQIEAVRRIHQGGAVEDVRAIRPLLGVGVRVVTHPRDLRSVQHASERYFVGSISFCRLKRYPKSAIGPADRHVGGDRDGRMWRSQAKLDSQRRIEELVEEESFEAKLGS